METTIIALLIIVGYVVTWSCWYWKTKDTVALMEEMETISAQVADISVRLGDVEHVLKEASRIRAQKDSPFEKDSGKIPSTKHYVPVARRRAEAEQASLGPQTHAEKVRANNARALETL